MLSTKPLKISAKDLTPRENRIISSLREEPKTTNEMAEEFGVTYHAVKKPLDGLVNKGLVEQDTERAFGKAKYYRMTTAGKKHLTHERSRWESLVQTVTRVLGPAQE